MTSDDNNLYNTGSKVYLKNNIGRRFERDLGTKTLDLQLAV